MNPFGHGMRTNGMRTMSPRYAARIPLSTIWSDRMIDIA